MFANMRKSNRKMNEEDCQQLLYSGEFGVLSLMGTNGFPHAVPMNYAYKEGKIWLHSAKAGEKILCMQAHNQVSFCIVGKSEVLPDQFSSAYQSIIIYGSLSEVFDDSARSGLLALIEKYSPDFLSEGIAYIEKDVANTSVLCLDIAHMTGKERKK